MSQIQSVGELIAQDIGESMAPAFETAAEKAWGLYDAFTQLDPSVKQAIGGFIALAAVGTVVGGVIAAISAIGLPLIGVIMAIGLAVAALYIAWQNNFLGIQDITKNAIAEIKPQWESLKPTFTEIGDSRHFSSS